MTDVPPHIPPDMAFPDFDEDDVHAKPFALIAGCLFIAAVTIGAIILLAWRGLQCGVI